MALAKQLESVITEKVTELGYDLVEMKFIKAGKHSVLRLFIDHDNGIHITDCETVSREVSTILDEKDTVSSSPYSLEVSSPGIDRPLKSDRDFQRVVGKNVKLRVKSTDSDKIVNVVGLLEGISEGVLQVKTGSTAESIALATILSGKLEITI